ncbi:MULTISPECIES: hypothetical protein [unclassified Methylobacterium]|jgi:hypothetical protein|uniref:hypothetical protein n=1 Tax=unclassified Methylobacterium TaxID=2615210 RepID=UPI001650A31D|nr:MULTISPECIES: hypothetical protein [unclassified Methylobacterium]
MAKTYFGRFRIKSSVGIGDVYSGIIEAEFEELSVVDPMIGTTGMRRKPWSDDGFLS